MSEIQFDGISGFINFTGNDRKSNFFSVNNYVNVNKTYHRIGVYNIQAKEVERFNVSVHWGRCCGSTVPPDRDHSRTDFGIDEGLANVIVLDVGKEYDCAGLDALAAELGGCAKAVAVVCSAGLVFVWCPMSPSCLSLYVTVVYFLCFHMQDSLVFWWS